MSDPTRARVAPPPRRYDARQLVHPPIWHAGHRTPVCRYGHPQVGVRDNTMVIENRGAYLRFQTCRDCSPSTHALGVVIDEPSEMAFYYAVEGRAGQSARDVFDELLRFPPRTTVLELLTFLGYAPTPDECK